MGSVQSRDSDDPPPRRRVDAGAADGLTSAEARALSRSAPLTPAEFKARRRLAERRVVPLRGVLDGDIDRLGGEQVKR